MIKDIIDSIVNIFSSKGLNLQTSYDVQQVVDGDGVVVISTSNIEKLHPLLKDYKITLNISGQTYIDNDIEQNKICDLFNKSSAILSELTVQDINVNGAVGYVFENAEIIDSESTHGFTAEFIVYVADFQL